MKTLKSFLSVCLMVVACSLSAQMTTGIRAGYINSWEDYGDVYLPENAKTHVNGIHVTGLLYTELGSVLSLGIEPGYAQKGAACFPGSFNFFYDTKFELDYIELPVMLTARLPIGHRHFGASIKAGYGASYLLSAFREYKEFGSNDDPIRVPEDIADSDLVKRWDSGFYSGLGLTYTLQNSQLFLESNYYHALNDAFKASTSKNRSIYIGLGYLIKV